MKKYAFLVSLLALTMVLALPSATLAGTTTAHIQGNSASASLGGYDPTGCIFTGINLFVTEDRIQSQGSPTTTQWLYASVYQWNDCSFDYNYTLSAYGSAELPAGAFQGSMSSATLQTTIPVYNWLDGSTSNLALDLTWSGTGDVFQGTNSSHYRYPGYQFLSRSTGSSRFADVAGSVRLDGTDLAPLQSPWSYASLSQIRSGSVSIFQPNPPAGQ